MKQSTNIYITAVPVFVRYLENLRSLIAKGETYAKRRRKSERWFLDARLAPDMFNFAQQVQYAYFMALETAVNLSGRNMPNFAYNEKTAQELRQSLTRAIRYLRSIKSEELALAHQKRVKTFLDPERRIAASTYVRLLALPNFFFHVTIAYSVLRHLGVRIGKDDYLGL